MIQRKRYTRDFFGGIKAASRMCGCCGEYLVVRLQQKRLFSATMIWRTSSLSSRFPTITLEKKEAQ